ncbi:MAG: indolepyruvate ferredoxin oxidoreductase [Ignavibacteriota bacterium]|nr:indolepyruvate ferredoxin oxidoreductase [Ignavibacteriota bacterium]MCO6448688.1 indolepyruvate ferredoxin oxidoreductase [Ignavibacterium album]MCZ2269915.1 indolepyruvate ferredoxin oxidoreductase [Ignavibacteriales bacterium]HOJ08443.1 thiamine pyrophosphate-dependent enzyme [Ignavibacteriaceae bacterium]MEB2355723.1 thiamine pyrophosphate-dependent enzyme [Ignavibacteriales bacterium]
MEKILLLGAEAIAQGAIDGGMSGIYAYPGTPSTEITEYVQNNKIAIERNLHRLWSANEKTAMETGLGMSYAGKRAMVCMKHVGLNVAADAFINSAITGVNGGLIITVADDPSMHSSQNEQDSRFFGKFAMIPIFEPSNQQEAYEMAYEGFELSERLKIPVLLRITTRLAHSRAGIERRPLKPENKLSYPEDPIQFVLLPANARKRYKGLLGLQSLMEQKSEQSSFNTYYPARNKSIGIIACGISFNYLMENFPDRIFPNPVLQIGQYPLPFEKIEKIVNECEQIIVLEDGYPFVEEMLKGFLDRSNKIKGRLDGTVPRDGELNPDIVAKALGKKVKTGMEIPPIVANRPPELCAGCSHRDIYNALNETMKEFGKQKVFSDIGCYTLGALPPWNSINSCVDMGASITMAKGAADAGVRPSIAVIGDSTFTHSGMTALLDCVYENSPVTVIISDNSVAGMTGGQDSPATGKLEQICIGIGVKPEHVRILTPLPKHHDEMVKILREEIMYDGVSVIISRRECIQTASRTKREQKVKTTEVVK